MKVRERSNDTHTIDDSNIDDAILIKQRIKAYRWLDYTALAAHS